MDFFNLIYYAADYERNATSNPKPENSFIEKLIKAMMKFKIITIPPINEFGPVYEIIKALSSQEVSWKVIKKLDDRLFLSTMM